MGNVIHAKNLSKAYNGKVIFEHVNFEIHEGERLALLGVNGAGKTTLLKLLTGELEPDSGTVRRRVPSSDWGVMEQSPDIPGGMTVYSAAASKGGELSAVKQRLEELSAGLSLPAPGVESNKEVLLQHYGDVLERYEQLGGYAWETELEKVLTMLNMKAETWQLPFGSLSGGQKTRVRLAALLVQRPSLLILDEPTNHLDEESIRWLEDWLIRYEGTVLFVSHDRTFLDRAATGICELTTAGIQIYPGGYSEYKREKERELREQEALYKKQKQAKEALEESIRRYQEWFHKAEAAASTNSEVKITTSFYKAKAKKNISRFHAKQQELARLEADRVEKPRQGPQVNMALRDSGFTARIMLRMERVSFGYEDRPRLLHDLDLIVSRGDRLAVRGENGSGKSTLAKLIRGKLVPNAGQLSMHPAVKIGYFSQELEGLCEEETLLGSLLRLPNMTETQARTILGCFLFSREDVFKQMGQLSMGEKCRAAFVQLLFSGANLLVLDEPTNYLDIQTREIVEDALNMYSGALIVVSHDRMLVRKLANRLLTLNPGQSPQLFEGTIAQEEEQLARHGGKLQEDPGHENERLMLELEIARLLREEDPEAADPCFGTERIQIVRRLRQQLAQLRG